ncbi:MAG: zinc-binding dehydrogenase [Leptospirales bacterium]|nr:zinc-binding dehydrogenase [Leptospirales bacterium]
MAKFEIPSRMRALELSAHGNTVKDACKNLKVVARDVPRPAKGQVLIRVEATPCNPSDLSYLQGTYSVNRPLPTVPGFEASGVVVKSGGGLVASWLAGKRVTCAGQSPGDGTWAEYFLADAMGCLPLRKGVDFEQGSALVVNPLTAFALLERAQDFGSKAVVQDAAASQLGRMILALANERGIPIVNIVRRSEQAQMLKQAGAAYVLDSSDNDFDQQLAKLAVDLNATTAFDCIGGNMSARLLEALPPRSQVIVYGGMSGEDPIAKSRDLVFFRKNLTGFHLAKHVEERGVLWVLKTIRQVQKRVETKILHTDFTARLSLADAAAGIAMYSENMSQGKPLLLPGKP